MDGTFLIKMRGHFFNKKSAVLKNEKKWKLKIEFLILAELQRKIILNN